MPKVSVKSSSSLSPDEAFSKVKNMLEQDRELKKLDPEINYEFNDGGLSGEAKGKFFKANMQVTASGDASEVEIVIDLPFHLALAKGLVQKTLQDKLNKNLGNV